MTLMIAAPLAMASVALAGVTYEPGFGGVAYYTHNSADNVISFDWTASSDFYYMTSGGFPDTNVWRANGANPVNVYAEPNNYAGASVLTIGDNVYFNDSLAAQNMWKYGPLSGSTSSSLVSHVTPNWGLYSDGSALFTTGAVGFGTSHIYYSPLDGNGNLTADPATDLGETFGGSGPLAFDASGNLYYAPGYNDKSIYRWDAAAVSDAIADPVNDPLPQTGVLWYDYSADYTGLTGAAGMAFDAEGDLLLTLTDFSNPSKLVEFDVDGTGAYASHQDILTSTDRLGDVRFANGGVYVANGNQVLQIVPEPSAFAALMGLASLLFVRRLQHRG